MTDLSKRRSGRRFAAKGKGRATKIESGVPFKPASPMKQAPAAQAGTFYGSIGGIIRYEPVRHVVPVAHANIKCRSLRSMLGSELRSQDNAHLC